MKQPDFLKTDDHVHWCWGKGNDVWAMFEAAGSGNVSRLEQLIDKEPSLVRCECHYRIPLHFAVRENRVDAARFLLSRDAQINPTYASWHDSCCLMARERGFGEMLKLIEDHQFSNWKICSAGNAIAKAFRARDVEQTRKLIATHGTEVADERGNKPIHWAVMTRQVGFVDSLVEQGADINAQRPDGARPLDLTNGDYWYRAWRDLHADAPRDHWQLMAHLLEKGADYDLTTACRRNDIKRVKEILSDDPDAAKHDANYSTWYSGYALRSAAKAGHIEIVRLLLEHGADPNRPEHGLAPWGASLYDAAQNGHFDVLKLLLENGGNPNQEVESSGCVLSAANDDRTRQLLRDHGAIYDPYGCCYYGYPEDFAIQCERDPLVANHSSLFAMAAERGHHEVVDIFLKNQPDLFKRMPATLGKTPELTTWMITNGMNVNQVDWLGIHLLHHGCDHSSLTILLDAGVDLNLIDDEHKSTPLGWAARRGDITFSKLLLDNGADPTLAGAEWAKPLAWAKRRGHQKLVELLLTYSAA